MADLYALLYHLKRCPPAFLPTSEGASGDKLHTDALVADVYRKVYGDFTVPTSQLPKVISTGTRDHNKGLSIGIGCWFFFHEFFAGKPDLLPLIYAFLFERLPQLSSFVEAPRWVEDEDRAEEFVRLALDTLDILPDGESADEATDKLAAMSTLKRHGVLQETNQSLARVREIRRKMAEAKAREAANVYGRE